MIRLRLCRRERLESGQHGILLCTRAEILYVFVRNHRGLGFDLLEVGNGIRGGGTNGSGSCFNSIGTGSAPPVRFGWYGSLSSGRSRGSNLFARTGISRYGHEYRVTQVWYFMKECKSVRPEISDPNTSVFT